MGGREAGRAPAAARPTVQPAVPGSWSRESRPRLARKVRLQWNAPRNQTLLLYPEGALALNPTAHAVLELCDGDRTLGDIVRELASRFDGSAAQRTSGESVPLSTDPGTGDAPGTSREPTAGETGAAERESTAGGAPGATRAEEEDRERLVERDVTAFLDQLAHRGWLTDEHRPGARP